MFPTIDSPTFTDDEWSDVDKFVNSVDLFSTSLEPVLTLGDQINNYLSATQKQLVIPQGLEEKLVMFLSVVKLIHDASSFLQAFPLFQSVLPPFTKSLGDQMTDIEALQGNTKLLIKSTSDFSLSLQVTACNYNKHCVKQHFSFSLF